MKRSLKKTRSASIAEKRTKKCGKILTHHDSEVKLKSHAKANNAEQTRGRKPSHQQAHSMRLPLSGVQQAVPPISEALRKFVSAVKGLFQQRCLLSAMQVDIQLSYQRDTSVLPIEEDWPEVQRHLQLLRSCLQELQRLVDAEQGAGSSPTDSPAYQAGQPAGADDVPGPAAGGPRSEASPVTAAGRQRSPPSQQQQESDQEADWLPAVEEAADSPEPPPAEAPADCQDTPAFVCTSGDCRDREGSPRRFASEKSLRMHEAACHGRKAAGRRYQEYTCPLCGGVQKRPRELASHIVTCQGKGEERPPAPADAGEAGSSAFIMCRLCHLCFPSGDMLRAHSCQYADSGGVIQELLGSGSLLSVSGAELASLRRFICHQCREEFRNPAIYRVHQRFCRPPPYACELCGLELPCGRQLVLHKMAEHRHLNEPLFFCRAPGCGLSFRLNAALQKHLVQRHSSQPSGQPHGCSVCGKKFIKKIYLTHHKLRYHHDTMQRDFVCEVCGARLGSSSALTVHVRAVHTRPEHPCTVCGKVFARADRLAVHAKIHTGERPHQCPLCPKAFIQQCKLNDHLRRHRGERRFRCVMCDKMYAASHDLRAHLRRIHHVDMVNKTHTIQPASSLLRPLPPEPEPEPEPPVQEPERPQQLPTVVPQAIQSVQLQPVQVAAAPAQALHVQDLSQLGGGLLLIPAVDPAGGAASFYPVIGQ